MTKRSSKLKKARIPEEERIAESIKLPMYRRGEWEAVDQGKISEGDAYKVLRGAAGKKIEHRTIRRRSRLGTAPMRKLLDERELAACEWYAAAHSTRYETLGITANYAAVGGGGRINFDHLPKTIEQEQAYQHFDYARAGISPSVIDLFEDVVLRCGLIGRRSLAFKVAVEQLLKRIEGKVELQY